MEFGLLGTLTIRAGGEPVPLPRRKQCALLVVLLLQANRMVHREQLVDQLWPERPPETVIKVLQAYVSKLRKVLPAGMLQTQPRGYLLEVEPDAVDLLRFTRLVAGARGADPAKASSLLREALDLWRGPPLAEFDEPFVRVEAARLEELRLAALEEWVDADLTLGRQAELVAELETLVAAHPHRERLRGQLMLALYRSGRQAEALDAYRDARAALDELGIEPGTALRQLERQILAQDDALVSRERATLPGPLVPEPAFRFVGRAGELATLRAALDRAERGQGGTALVGAEAGGGKTRLVRELAIDAAARGALVLYGTSDAMVTTPYQPLREWLELLARELAPDALEAALGERRGLVARLVPELGQAAAAEVDRFALQSAALEVLRHASRAHPLVLAAEDVHWADAESLQLLRRLAATAPGERMLVLATYRDRGEQLTPGFAETLAELSRLDGVTRLSLASFSDEEVGAFVEAPELAAAVAELTGGNALLVCETCRDLRAGTPLDELRGPERIRDIVRQRLARLSAQTVSTVELAAVSGRQCELGVLADAARLDPGELVASVGEAVRNGLLEELWEPASAYRFTHELVRRAVYDRVAAIDRAHLHLQIADALERAHATDPAPVLPDLAHHFTLAAAVGGAGRAVDYNLRAARAAIAAASHDEGAARLATALELGIPDPRERARTQVELAYLYRDLGRAEDSDRMLAASLDAATGLDERGVAARALMARGISMGNPALDPAHMQAVGEEALETFRQLGDEQGLAYAGRRVGLALNRAGRLAECCAAYEQTLVHAEASGDQWMRRQLAGGLALALSVGPAPVGQAIRRCRELRTAARDDRALEAVADRCLGALLAMAGELEGARKHLERSSPVLDELGQGASWNHVSVAAHAKLLLGDRAGAEADHETRWHWHRELGDYDPNAMAMQSAYQLALLYCDDGRWDDAERCLAYGADVPEPDYFLIETALGHAGRARLAAHRGELADALALARRGVECADRSDMLGHRATARLALAEVQRAAGESPNAAVAEALRLYDAKGNVTAAAQLRARTGVGA